MSNDFTLSATCGADALVIDHAEEPSAN